MERYAGSTIANFYLERTMSNEPDAEAVGQVSCRNCRRQVPRTSCICPYCGCESPFIVNRRLDEILLISVSIILVMIIGYLTCYNIGKFINW